MAGTQIGSFTNFPQGFANGLSVRGMPLLQMQQGQVFYVGNGVALNPSQKGASNGNRGTILDPFSTLTYAINTACTQGRGDIVFVLPGHYETIPDATTLVFGCNGVAVIGLGSGDNRPTLSFDTATTANIPVRSGDMSIQNFRFLANFADIASTFTGIRASHTASISGTTLTSTTAGTALIYPGASVMGTGIIPGTYVVSQLTGSTGGVGTYTVSQSQTFASGTLTFGTHNLSVDNCDFVDLTASLNFVVLITGNATTNAMSGLALTNSRKYGLSTVTGTYIVSLAAAQKGLTISGNYLAHQNDENGTLVWQVTDSHVITDVFINGNTFIPVALDAATGLFWITTATTHTGVIQNNYANGLRAIASATWITANSGLKFYENYYALTADKSGVILPAAQT